MSDETTPVNSITPSLRFSTEIGQLTAALAAAQLKFAVITKNKRNPHTNSHYADLQSIVAATQPALAAEGLAILQLPIVRDRNAGCLSRLAHKSGEFAEVELLLPTAMPGRENKFDAQSIGSAITYSKRYSWTGLTGAVAEDDDDGNAAAESQKDQKTPVQTKARPEPVKAPTKVNPAPATENGRLESATLVPKAVLNPPTNAQGGPQTNELPADGLPTAQDLDAVAAEQAVSEATSSVTAEESSTSPRPSPEQFEAFKKRAAEIRIVLEKAGLKPSTKPPLSTGAKLVKYFTFTAGVQKVDELSINQWDTIFGVLDTLINTNPHQAVDLIDRRIQ